MSASPLIRHFTHRQGLATFNPGHECSIERERRPAFAGEELPDLLRIAVVFIQRGGACNGASVPVEDHFHSFGDVNR